MTRAKWAALGLVVMVVIGGVGLIAAAAGPVAEPNQPFVFPHDIHAGDLQIPCMYCHYGADRSYNAGIPPMSVCAGCHLPGGAPLVAADSPGVRIFIEHWNEARPIEWVRDHRLPDHARFPHMMHVKAEVDCQECHGPVEEVEQVGQVSSLRMGWCVQCHQERGARIDCTVCHY